jgi:hypothetical protein
MCLLYVYVIRQGPNQYPSCALTWTRTSLVHCTPREMNQICINIFKHRFLWAKCELNSSPIESSLPHSLPCHIHSCEQFDWRELTAQFSTCKTQWHQQKSIVSNYNYLLIYHTCSKTLKVAISPLTEDTIKSTNFQYIHLPAQEFFFMWQNRLLEVARIDSYMDQVQILHN